MSADDILKDLKSGVISPLYLLHGEESYYIDNLVDYIEDHLLSEMEKAFNQVVIYGKDANITAIIDEARQYPMMSAKRLILLKEAQQMKGISDLLPYAEKPVSTTVLVICYKYGKLDKRTKFYKALESKGVIFESKKIYDNQVASWVRDFLKAGGYTAANGVHELVAEYLGSDLSKVSNELTKLMLNVPKSRQITMDDVRDVIGISKEFDVFELQKMLGERNFAKATQIINYLSDNQGPNPAVVIITNLFGYFNKVMITNQHGAKSDQELSKLTGINPFFLKEYRQAAKNYSKNQLVSIFQALKNADKASKGIGNRRNDVSSIYKDFLISCMTA
ncbi:MAG: DNA polymerase III subunit delta [Saprospiraceae bacterium]